jgi:hypothetical protein
MSSSRINVIILDISTQYIQKIGEKFAVGSICNHPSRIKRILSNSNGMNSVGIGISNIIDK